MSPFIESSSAATARAAVARRRRGGAGRRSLASDASHGVSAEQEFLRQELGRLVCSASSKDWTSAIVPSSASVRGAADAGRGGRRRAGSRTCRRARSRRSCASVPRVHALERLPGGVRAPAATAESRHEPRPHTCEAHRRAWSSATCEPARVERAASPPRRLRVVPRALQRVALAERMLHGGPSGARHAVVVDVRSPRRRGARRDARRCRCGSAQLAVVRADAALGRRCRAAAAAVVVLHPFSGAARRSRDGDEFQTRGGDSDATSGPRRPARVLHRR